MLQHIQEKLSDLTLNKFCKKFTRYFFPFFLVFTSSPDIFRFHVFAFSRFFTKNYIKDRNFK